MNNAETKNGVQVTQRKEFWDFFFASKTGDLVGWFSHQIFGDIKH
jgi:hypothetical protein